MRAFRLASGRKEGARNTWMDVYDNCSIGKVTWSGLPAGRARAFVLSYMALADVTCTPCVTSPVWSVQEVGEGGRVGLHVR